MVKTLALIVTGSMFSTLVQALSLQGVSDFAASMQLNAASAGVVQSIMVKPGQTVKPGQLLIKLDDTAHQARLQRAEARQQSLLPAVTTAELEFERAQELYDRDSLSQVELTRAETSLLKAQGDHQAAAAEVKLAAHDLRMTEVVAPEHARVWQVLANQGLYVDPAVTSTPLLILVSSRQMKAVGLISPDQWDPALLNKKATVKYRQQSFDGIVSHLGMAHSDRAAAQPAYELHVIFDSRQILPAGMQVSIEVAD